MAENHSFNTGYTEAQTKATKTASFQGKLVSIKNVTDVCEPINKRYFQNYDKQLDLKS